jgi:DNA replication protein DnaC
MKRRLEKDDLFVAERLPVITNKFSPRIQKVLSKLTFPEERLDSAFIYGSVGSGKTIHAISMLISECYFMYMHRLVSPKWLFIPVPEFMYEVKKSYNRDADITESQILEKYSEVEVLILDDLGVEKTSDWAFQLLYILINRRYENQKKTIITSNFSLEELSKRLGDDRISSRIQGMCKLIEKSGNDYRITEK